MRERFKAAGNMLVDHLAMLILALLTVHILKYFSGEMGLWHVSLVLLIIIWLMFFSAIIGIPLFVIGVGWAGLSALWAAIRHRESY